MSALPPEAAAAIADQRGSFGPETDSVQQRTSLFDHLVGERDERWWDFEAESPSGLEIDD